MSIIEGKGSPDWGEDKSPKPPKPDESTGVIKKIATYISGLFSSKKELADDKEIEMQDFTSIIPKKPVEAPSENAKQTSESVEKLATKATTDAKDPSSTKKKITKAEILQTTTSPEALRHFGPPKKTTLTQDDLLTIRGTSPPLPATRPRYSEDIQKDKIDLMLKSGADLKTPQGLKAEWHAARIHALLTSAVVHSESLTFDKINPDAPPMKELYVKFMTSLSDFVTASDLNNKDHCHMLNTLATLMHRSFNADIGGLGCVRDATGWKESWNDVGVNVEFKPGLNQEDLKVQFQEMLTFLRTADLFGDKAPLEAKVLAAGQLMCTLGITINDILLEKESSQDVRELLASKMYAQGIFHTSQVSGTGEILSPQLEKLKYKLRSSPLIAEVMNFMLRSEIYESLKIPKVQDDMLRLIGDALKGTGAQTKLTSIEIAELSQKILLQFTENIKNLPINTLTTGSRGRLPFDPNAAGALMELGKALAGHEGVQTTIALSPNRANDEWSIAWVKAIFGDDPKVEAFFKAAEGSESIFKHSVSPIVPLRLGKGLDGHFVALLDPQNLFKETIDTLIAKDKTLGPGQVEALKALSKKTKSPEFSEKYVEILGSIKITFNKVTKQKIELKEFAAMPSVAAIMYRNDIRMVCSISATTIASIFAAITTRGDAKVKELLQPLVDHIKGVEPDPLTTPEGQKFKEFASSLCFFMQAGQYHAAGEVLGGLYVAGRALSSTEEEIINIEAVFKDFTSLMKEFSKKPETFFAVSPDDIMKIYESRQLFRDTLISEEKARIQQMPEETI